MKRNILTIIFIICFLLSCGSASYACDPLVISIEDSYHGQVGDETEVVVNVTSGTVDEDGWDPNGEGLNISIKSQSGTQLKLGITGYDVNSYELHVDAHSDLNGNASVVCNYYVANTSVSCLPFVPYGSGMDISFSIEPPYSVSMRTVYVRDSNSSQHAHIVDPSNSGIYHWDGICTYYSSPYYNDFLPPGTYTAGFKAGAYFKAEQPFIIFSTEVNSQYTRIPYGSGMNFYFNILPEEGWMPDSVYFWIGTEFDPENAYFMDPGIYSFTGSSTYPWDGKTDSETYLEPGHYTAYLLAYKEESDVYYYDTTDFDIIGVQSLLPYPGEYTEINDGDSNPDTKSFVMPISSGTINIKATPDPPDVNISELPEVWNYTGGTEVNDFIHTVSMETAGLTTLQCQCGGSSKTTKIYVVDVNLITYKRDGSSIVSDTDEENPGAYVSCNYYTNDDNDSTRDSDDIIVPGEKDLIKMHFAFPAFFVDFNDGKVVIERENDKIKLWKQKEKGSGNEIVFSSNKKTYDLSDPNEKDSFVQDINNSDLWIEGCSNYSTSLKDTGIKLSYTDSSDTEICSDTVKITVVALDLWTYLTDNPEDSNPLSFDKEIDPGNYILYNNDDDNGNGIIDVSDPGSTANENDLRKVYFSFAYLLFQNYLETGKVVIERSNDKLKLWKDPTRTNPMTFDVNDQIIFDLSNPTQRSDFRNNIQSHKFYLEGASPSTNPRDVKLTQKYLDSDNVEICVSPVKYTVIGIDKIEIEYSSGMWDNVTDGNIVVLKGAKYDFRALSSGQGWPDDPNYSAYWLKWTFDGNQVGSLGDEAVEIDFTETGTFPLIVKCGQLDEGKHVNIKVVTPEPDQVSFVDNIGNEEHEFYDVSDPVWKRIDDPNDPASYTKKKKMKINVKFWASDNLTYLTPVKVDASGFSEDTSVNFQTWPSEITEHISDSNLADTLGTETFNITYSYKVVPEPNQLVNIASESGPHKIYRVYDAPPYDPCNPNDPCDPNTIVPYYYNKTIIAKVFKIINDEDLSTEAEIASYLNDHVSHDLYADCICSSSFQRHIDEATEGATWGMCCCRAKGLNCVLQVLGIGPYTRIYCNEMPEDQWGTKRHMCEGYCVELEVFVFRGFSGGNCWEGAIRSGDPNSIAYAPGIIGDNGITGTHDQIASSFGPYSWYYEDPEHRGSFLECNYDVILEPGCSAHSIYWGRFDEE